AGAEQVWLINAKRAWCSTPTAPRPQSVCATRERPAGSPVTAHTPDLLSRPAASPREGSELRVRRRGARWGAQLDEVLDGQPVATEGPHPLAVGDLEVDRALTAGEDPHAEVVGVQAGVLATGDPVIGQVQQRGRLAEHESTTRAEQPGHLRHRDGGVTERHRAVVAEHQIETGVPERGRLRAGGDEREPDLRGTLEVTGVAELSPRLVEPD